MSSSPRDPIVAVAMHKLSAAIRAQDKAEAWASGRGIDPADLRRALEALTASAEATADREGRMGRLLHAIRAPGVIVEEVEVVERIRDETPEERRERLFSEGYIAGVLGMSKAARRLRKAADRELFLAGWDAFAADFSKHT